MQQAAKALSEQAVQLPPVERMALVEQILDSLPDGHLKLLHLWPPKFPQAEKPKYPLLAPAYASPFWIAVSSLASAIARAYKP